MQKVVAVFDRKTMAYCPPMFVAHEELVVREFQVMAERPGNGISSHPSDYELHLLGQADLQGRFKVELHEHPEVLCNAGSHMRGRIEEYEKRLSELKAMSEEEFARLMARPLAKKEKVSE